MDNVLALPAPDLTECLKPESKFEVERSAFYRMMPELLAQYVGKCVAIHDEKVVAVGSDVVTTAMEAYKKYGYQEMYVHEVTHEPPRVWRMPSSRQVREEISSSSAAILSTTTWSS
jgi:hypothetical protein